MAHKLVVMVDTNILIDAFQKREPFSQDAIRLITMIEEGKVIGYISGHSITTFFYLMEKHLSSAEARAIITTIMLIFKIATVDQSTIEQALNLEFKNFEDAVQMVAALQCKADVLVSRNVKDFFPPLLPVMQPVDFLAAYPRK